MNGNGQALLQHQSTIPFQRSFTVTSQTQLPPQSNRQTMIGTCQDFQIDLYQKLNTTRSAFKKRSLSQDVLGELALTEILQVGVSSQSDSRFFEILGKYNIAFSGTDVELMIYENHQIPKQSYLTGGFSPDEVKQALSKSLEDMMNGTFRMKLIQNYQFTHIAFACMQTGAKMNVFRVACLATKKALTIESIIQCCTGIRSTNGVLIMGRTLSPTVKPYIFVANRGQQNQIVVGPNRMGYNPEEGEFRIAIPDEYQPGSAYTSQILMNSMFEIFVTSSEDQSFMYGQGLDMPQNFSNFGMEVGISDLIPDSSSPYYQQRVTQRNDSLSSVFNQKDLLLQSNIMKVNVGGPLMHSNTVLPNTQQFNTQPAFGRSMTTFQPSQVPQPLKPMMTSIQPSQQNNENYNPNIPYQHQQQQPQMPIKFSLNAPYSLKNGANNGIQSSMGTNFMRSATTVVPQPQIQNQMQQPQLKFNFATNTATQVPPLVLPQPTLPQQAFTNQFTRSQTTTTFQTQPSLLQQPKITLKYGTNQSKPEVQLLPQPQPQQQKQQPLHQQSPVDNPMQSRTPLFNELSLIDQQTLQGYLKELQEDLTAEQFQRVTALMLTDPVKFYEYFQIAHSQLQLTTKSKSNPSKPSQQEEEEKKQQPSKTLSEFDDLTVFFLTIPQTLIEGRETQYEELLKEVKECKLSQRALLKKLIIRQKFPINESFKGMLSGARETADMILELRSEEFPCHKIVMTSTSDYFKKALKENEYMNKYQYNVRGPYRHQLIVPEWMDPKALRLFLNYVYTGKVTNQGDGRSGQIDPIDVLNLLKIGNFFFHQYLQEHLIAEIIIPSMNPQTAVLYLKECFSNLEDNPPTSSKPSFRKNCTYAWNFLYDYAQFYLQKHLPKLLKSSPHLAYELPSILLRRLIDKSLLFVVDGASKDLDTILQFTADTWTQDKSITTLFKKSQSTMDSCSAFDYQYIPQMEEFIKMVDPAQDYQCKLTRDQEGYMKPQIVISSPNNSPGDQKMAGEEQKQPDSTFYNAGTQSAKLLVDNDDVIDINAWKPSANIIKAVPNTDTIFDKEPQYQTTINLEDPSLKESFIKNKGITIFSKAFDFGRRSWMLKIDIDFEGYVSLYIVERGSPVGKICKDGTVKQDENLQLGLMVPIKFSSILTQFELFDPAFGDHKSQFFYSFAHDQFQVIGHEKIINISQLQNKNQLKIKIMMKEFLMHSALMWYVAQNFQDLYGKDLKQMDIYKKNTWSVYTQHLNGKDYEIFNLRFYTVYQLLQSHHLKVETENLVLGYLYHYTRVFMARQPSKSTFTFVTDFLSTSIRFSHLSSSKLLSALRDNEYLRASRIFIQKTQEEFLIRAQLPQASFVLLKISPPSKHSTTNKSYGDPKRLHYDENKLKSAVDGGRMRYLDLVNGQSGLTQGALFIEDLIEWLKKSKHGKKEDASQQQPSQSNQSGDQYVRQEVMKLQALYYEERRKCQDLQSQVTRLERRNEELEKMLGISDQWKYGVQNQMQQYRTLRRSLSNNDLVGNHRRQNQGGYYSPPQTRKENGGYISNNDIINAANKPRTGGAAAAANNSFDQSEFFSLKNNNSLDPLFNETYRNHPLGGSTAKADRRLIVNQYADMSRLLNRIDRVSPKHINNNMRPGAPLVSRNAQTTSTVPYYRANKNGKDQEGDCLIF